MKTIKITDKQFRKLLVESGSKRTLINENLRDVLLGVAKLMDFNLSGLNKELANKALSDKKIMLNIKNTLEDDNKIKELAKTFGEKGMKEPDLLIAKKAKQIFDNYNSISKNNNFDITMDSSVIDKLEGLSKDLVKEKETKAKNKLKTKSIEFEDKLELLLDSDKCFINSSVLVNSNFINLINDIIEFVNNGGGSIISIMIESSSDSEPNYKLKSKDDLTGNITLTTTRTKNIADLIKNINDDIRLTHREIPNNGSYVVDYEEFINNKENQEELVKLRKKTKEFRYTKLKINYKIITTIDGETKPELLIKDFRVNFKNNIKEKGSNIIDNGSINFNNKTVTCKSSDKKMFCNTK